MRKLTIITILIILLSSTVFISCSDFLSPEVIREIIRWSTFWSSDEIVVRSIDALSDTNYWFAGRDITSSNITIGHYADGTWSFTSIDDGGYSFINSIDMLSDTEGWFVGNFGVVYHLDNGTWAEATDYPGSDTCYQVQALSASSVWVLASDGIYHFNGLAWTSYDVGDNISRIFMYDGSGYAFSSNNNTFYAWDGSAWTQEDTTLPGVDTGFISSDGTGYLAAETTDAEGNYTVIYERTPGTPITYTEVYSTAVGISLNISTGNNSGSYFFAGDNASVSIVNGTATDLKAAPPEGTGLTDLQLLSTGKIIAVGSGSGSGKILKN